MIILLDFHCHYCAIVYIRSYVIVYHVHVPTELGLLSGVASILRFPLPEPEDSDASDHDDDD